VPIVPFVVLPAGAVLAWTRGVARRVAWAAFGALMGLGVVVNVGGVVVDQRVSFVRLFEAAGGDLVGTNALRWEPARSPVLIHWQEIAKRLSTLAQTLPEPVSLVAGTYGKETSAGATGLSSDLFPRWTSGAAIFELRTYGQPAELILVYLDNRPEEIGPAVVQLWVNGAPLPTEAFSQTQSTVALPDKRFPWIVEARLGDALAGRTGLTLEVRSNTWQPARDTPPSADIRELGVQIWDLQFRSNGQVLPIGEAVFVPMPVSDARPWSSELETWFYTPPWHAADVWLWYLYLSGLPRGLMLLGLVPLAGLLWSSVRLTQLVRGRASLA